MRIAVLGLGHMGGTVARRLIEHDHDVTVWNRSPDRAVPLAQAGATVANDPREAGRDTEAVFVSVRDDAAVTEVLTAIAGVGVPIVNLSTSAPTATADLAAQHPTFVASPILGAPQAVASGTAAYLVAGPEAATAVLEPVWPALTDRVVRLGTDPVRASAVKVISNHLLLTGIAALAEAVAVGQAAGLPDDLLSEVLGASPVVAPALRNRLDDIVSGDHVGWFDTPMGAKDLRLFEALASDVPTPLATQARQQYDDAAAAGWAAADVAAVVELLRRPTSAR